MITLSPHLKNMSVEDWNNRIITNWNSVTDDDKVLGFWHFGKGFGKRS